ncbi:MAG: Ig-like domain-containing protein [Gemmatimonadales bacterium]
MLAELDLSPTTVGLATLGQTAQLSATGRDAGGASMPPGPLVWQTSAPGVASVSATGLVTALGDGTAEITATAGSVSAQASVSVDRVLAALELAPTTLTLLSLGQTAQLTATGRDAGGAQMPPGALTWTSGNPAVASVSGSGLVTAVGDGTTQITLSSGAVSAQASVTVATLVANLTISGGQSPFKGIDGTMQLSATARNATGQPVVVPIQWSSSDPSVASISNTGLVTTHRQGTTTIQATGGARTATWPLTIQTVYRVPVDPFLATPIAGARWVLPVVLVWYLPTRDGIDLDVRKSPDFWSLNPKTLAQMEAELMGITRRRKMMVEQGTRFRGYASPTATPSIGYRVIEHIVIYDIPPASNRTWTGVPTDPRFPDYHRVFAELGISALVNGQGVREVWVAASSFDAGFPSYDPAIHRAADMRVDFESNMSSPTTGDISNSFRWNDDLPVLDHTYIVYTINFRRSQAEAVHNVGHQLEAMFSHVAWAREGNTALFWRQFVGQDPSGNFITGRAGWTHMPPNTIGNYDYLNPTLVPSDIEDWRPAGGATKPVSVSTWAGLTYPWPGGPPPSQGEESQWYVYWMQNMPGAGNQIPHGTGWMTNWWAFVADWDAAFGSGLGLYGATPAASAGGGTQAVPRPFAVPPDPADARRWPVHRPGESRRP